MYSNVASKLLIKKGYEIQYSNEVERLNSQLKALQKEHEVEREEIAKCYILECEKKRWTENQSWTS